MKTIRARLLIVLLPPIIGLLLILLFLWLLPVDQAKRAILWIALASCLWLAGSVWFISYNITAPIKKLKNAALQIASGDYEETIFPEGPQEIKELAGTLNTMRECLLENISRLTDSSPAREKLYGEYECAELLQYEMFDKALEALPEEEWIVKKARLTSAPQLGLSVDWNNGVLSIEESEHEGFHGIYELLTKGSSKKGWMNLKTGELKFDKLEPPLLWSEKDRQLTPFKAPKPGDIVILYNSGLLKQMHHPQILKDWFTKILKHFAKDGLDLTGAMIQSELNFFQKKYLHHEDVLVVLIAPRS